MTDMGETRIFVLQRGWVVVGKIVELGHRVKLFPASNVRRWGTTRGLGELANGPTAKTVIDPLPFGALFNELTVVLEIPCDATKWTF